MTKPKWVLKSLLLSAIFLSVTMIQVQNSRAGNSEDVNAVRARLVKEMQGHTKELQEHSQAAAIHYGASRYERATRHVILAELADAKLNACMKAFGELSVAPFAGRRIQDCPDDFLRNAQIGTRVNTAVLDEDGSTLIGAIFERVKFGKSQIGWRQMFADGSRGLIWGARIGDFTNDNKGGQKSQAEEECEKRGGRLPSIDDFRRLRVGFDFDNDGLLSEWGKSEFHRLFPDMKGHVFWTLSPVSSSPDEHAWVVNGEDGDSSDYDTRVSNHSVLCVGQ